MLRARTKAGSILALPHGGELRLQDRIVIGTGGLSRWYCYRNRLVRIGGMACLRAGRND